MSETRLRVILLNALVLPGTGHFYVKHRVTGVAIAVPSLLSALLVLVKFVLIAYSFFASATADLMMINRFYQQLWADVTFSYSLILLALLWVGSVADSFRITEPK